MTHEGRMANCERDRIEGTINKVGRRLVWAILGSGAMIGLGLASRPIFDYLHWYLELAN